jgi:hypothetical protein
MLHAAFFLALWKAGLKDKEPSQVIGFVAADVPYIGP